MRLEGQKVTHFGMSFGMWVLFAPSFRKQLTAVFGCGTNTAKAITKKAKSEYRRIIAGMKVTAALKAADHTPYSWNIAATVYEKS